MCCNKNNCIHWIRFLKQHVRLLFISGFAQQSTLSMSKQTI